MRDRPRVLLLDDSDLALELAKHVLEAAGMAVDCAQDLASFEALRASTSPDIILVDVHMPEVFGDDLAGTLRGVYGVRVPILLFSSLDEPELARRAMEADVDGYVSKQAGPKVLVDRVRRALGVQTQEAP